MKINFRLMIGKEERVASILLCLGLLFSSLAPQFGWAISTLARQALIVDAETGTILFQKAPDEPMMPSSMTKVMTALIAFDAISSGEITLEQRFQISRKAWSKPGSKMFLLEGTFVTVDDLLHGLIIQSGNDAAIALAEGISGSEEKFVERMNRRAAGLGMNTTLFQNASGWPDPDHYTTARDLAKLSMVLIKNYPQFYYYFSIKSFKYAGIFQKNRNSLLNNQQLGADGIKTGYTKAGGYGIVGSARLKERRVIMILNGLKSKSARASESEKLMDWALRNFENHTLFKPLQVVDYAKVWLGIRRRVPLVISNSLRLTLPVGLRPNLRARVMYNGPVPAPIAAGERLGDLQLIAPGMTTITLPLLAGEEVERLGRLSTVISGLRYALFGEEI